ncbi:hypothetical protein C6A85_14435, partial [Mycobacterium sp. ITM-2017-0098]
MGTHGRYHAFRKSRQRVGRFERKLEDKVGDAFARVFGGSIVPQEVESLLRREADAGAH